MGTSSRATLGPSLSLVLGLAIGCAVGSEEPGSSSIVTFSSDPNATGDDSEASTDVLPDLGDDGPTTTTDSPDSCALVETACSDFVDDDCDQLLDCSDPDCDALPCGGGRRCTQGACQACTPTELDCSNGADDDCDGHIDCEDVECEGIECAPGMLCSPGVCGCTLTETQCGDGVDDDCDGAIDCADSDCNAMACTNARCIGAFCDAASTCIDGHCTWSGENCDSCPNGYRVVQNCWDGGIFSCDVPAGWRASFKPNPAAMHHDPDWQEVDMGCAVCNTQGPAQWRIWID